MGIGTTEEFAIDREPDKLRMETACEMEELIDLSFHSLENPLILKEVVICCEQVLTIGCHYGRAIGDDTKVSAVNFFGDNPLHFFESAILCFIQVPLPGRFGNLFVANPANDSYPPAQCAFNYDNILENNYLALYGYHHFEATKLNVNC